MDQQFSATKNTSSITSPPTNKPGSAKTSEGRRRRTGESHTPFSRRISSGSDISGDEGFFLGGERRDKWYPDKNTWHTTTIDNSIIVGMYGDNSYPLLMWNPDLKVEFKLSSSVGLHSEMVTGIDPTKPTVTMKVVNSSADRVAFSIRVYRQSSMVKYHIAYPSEGLHILEGYMSWEDNSEFYSQAPEKNEYFVIDLFVCTLGGGLPSWNVVRKYAVLKASKR